MILAWGLLACRGEPVPPTVYEVPTPVVLPTPPDEPRRNDERGDVFLLQRSATQHTPTTLEVAALFADRLDGALYPAACRWSGLLCAPPGVVPGSIVERVEADVGRSAWLGDRIAVGGMEPGFSVDPVGPVGGYAGGEVLEGTLPTTLDLVVEEGEWGTFEALSAVRTPDDHAGLSPDPLAPVELGSSRFLEIGWTPTGSGRTWITVEGAGLDVLRSVPDDGLALVDLGDTRIVEPVDVTLWRVRTTTREVPGDNTIRVHGAVAQSWCVVETCGDPPVPSWPAYLPFTYCWSADSCATSQWILEADGDWAAEGSFGGDWTWDCCSRELAMVFRTGTVYRGTVDADGCIEGEMTSWSGARGTWSGCF